MLEHCGLCPQTPVTALPPIEDFCLRIVMVYAPAQQFFTVHQATYNHLPRTIEVIRVDWQ